MYLLHWEMLKRLFSIGPEKMAHMLPCGRADCRSDGWRCLRRQVQEEAGECKKKATSLDWEAIRGHSAVTKYCGGFQSSYDSVGWSSYLILDAVQLEPGLHLEAEGRDAGHGRGPRELR